MTKVTITILLFYDKNVCKKHAQMMRSLRIT